MTQGKSAQSLWRFLPAFAGLLCLRSADAQVPLIASDGPKSVGVASKFYATDSLTPSVDTIAVAPDGTMYLGGTFHSAGGTLANNIVGLYPNGTFFPMQHRPTATTISVGTDGPVNVIAVGAGGSPIWIGGSFQTGGSVAAQCVVQWTLNTGFKPIKIGSTAITLEPATLGTNAVVYALGVKGSSDLFVGGSFVSVNGIPVNGIFRYNSSGIFALTSSPAGTMGLTDQFGAAGTVNALLVQGSALFIGGSFEKAGDVSSSNVAIYNMSTFTFASMSPPPSPLGGLSPPSSCTPGSVYALALLPSGSIAIGGQFVSASGSTTSNLCTWDGTVFRSAGSVGGAGGTVRAIAVNSTDIIVAGSFASVGGVAAVRIENGVVTAFRTGVSSSAAGSVNALLLQGSTLWSGGTPALLGDTSLKNLMSCNTSGYCVSPALSYGPIVGFNLPITKGSLAAVGSQLIISGQFTQVAGSPTGSLVAFDGSKFTTLGPLNIQVQASVPLSSTDLLVGGGKPDGQVTSRLVLLGSGSQQALPTGLNIVGGTVNALAVYGGLWAVGGSELSTGGSTVANAFLWDGFTLTSLTTDGPVNAFAFSPNGSLLVGGSFSTVGGVTVNSICRCAIGAGSCSPLTQTASNKKPVGVLGASGAMANVYAIATNATDVFIGGDFATAGGIGISSATSTTLIIVRYDGSNFVPLATIVPDNSVKAVLVVGADLWLAGAFKKIGATEYNGIARWVRAAAAVLSP
jgi:trimeric autotransporter adhesin